jgi:uroporphyrinogen-III synthase
MRILVTRPEPEALKLKGVLEQRGHEAVVEPLLAVSFDDCDAIDLDGVTGLIATSRNGLRALRQADLVRLARGLTVFAVGAATADEARRMGFQTVVKGPGTAAALAPMIASALDPTEEMLLHLAGERLAVDIAAELEQQGFRCARATVYRMVAAERLSDSVREQMAAGDIEAAVFMSADTAAVYARLVARHHLGPAARGVCHICLSEGVAGRLRPLGVVPVEVADRPTLEEVLALVDLTAAQVDH